MLTSPKQLVTSQMWTAAPSCQLSILLGPVHISKCSFLLPCFRQGGRGEDFAWRWFRTQSIRHSSAVARMWWWTDRCQRSKCVAATCPSKVGVSSDLVTQPPKFDCTEPPERRMVELSIPPFATYFYVTGCKRWMITLCCDLMGRPLHLGTLAAQRTRRRRHGARLSKPCQSSESLRHSNPPPIKAQHLNLQTSCLKSHRRMDGCHNTNEQMPLPILGICPMSDRSS